MWNVQVNIEGEELSCAHMKSFNKEGAGSLYIYWDREWTKEYQCQLVKFIFFFSFIFLFSVLLGQVSNTFQRAQAWRLRPLRRGSVQSQTGLKGSFLAFHKLLFVDTAAK